MTQAVNATVSMLLHPQEWRIAANINHVYRLLKMEFRTFVNTMMRVPCQIVRTVRRCAI